MEEAVIDEMTEARNVKKYEDLSKVWLSSAYHRRSDFLSREFGCAYYHFGEIRQARIVRYLFSLLGALKVIRRTRCDLLFVQNPSLAMTVFLVALKPLFGYRIVNDLHTPYVALPKILDRLFWRMQEYCIRNADLTLVTNEDFAATLKGERIYVLPDKLPTLRSDDRRELEGKINILYVCSFAEDEPFDRVFSAAAGVPDTIHLYVTGNYSKRNISPDQVPPNVHLTGYIPEEEYASLLNSVDLVMTLTEQDHCIVCGGYEGTAQGKPLILSDKKALRDYFSRGAVYVEHDVDSLREGMVTAAGEREKLAGEISQLYGELQDDWRERFEGILEELMG